MLERKRTPLKKFTESQPIDAEEVQLNPNSIKQQSSASSHISSNRDIIFRTSLLNYPIKLGLIILTLVLVSFSAFSFPETLFHLQIGTAVGEQIGIVVPILAIVPALLFLSILLRIYDQQYSIGLESITSLSGTALFLRTRSLQSYLNEIRSIEVTRTLLQRVFHIGDVQIRSLGSEHSEAILEGVRNPDMIKGIIEHRRHQLKSSERTFHQRSIHSELIN